MIYPSINIQGNIVSNEILQKLAEENCKHQNPLDFGLEKNARIGDEVGNVWRVLRRQWEAFKAKQERIAENETGFTETRQYWISHFLSELGYELVQKAKDEDPSLPTINYSCKKSGSFPIQIESYRQSLDKRPERGGSSPHARMQEYLNKTDDHLYGIVTNGLYLRLLRNASRLVKLSYLEFNLEKIMEENIYADFAVLFRILHASRMPQQNGEGDNSIIEYYHQESMAAGTRIRTKLSEAVEKSIKGLANGFLKHPANNDLRRKIRNNEISETEFYQYMLRLIYRILFLSVIEERKLIYNDNLGEEENQFRDIYYRYYSIERFRKLAGNHHFVDKYKQDLWDNLRANFRLFENEQYGKKLGIRPLGGNLFGTEGIGLLADCHLGNQAFMEMMLWLNFFEDERKQLMRVNYGDLDVEEFGSVYEGLLEYDPVIKAENDHLSFDFKAGDARARSGSHYTPEELVKPLIKHSLEYIIDDCIKKPHERLNLPTKPTERAKLKELQEKALLSITVCDVACGSGHILLSAARRIGLELARVRTGDEQPDPASQRQATRDAIRHCIYGVDLNPLAVELCKVALWLEAHSPGEPLNFLDHKIKCGNSIVGLAHKDELEKGIADEAFKALPGDNKTIASAFKSRNKQERKQQTQLGLFDKAITEEVNAVIEKFQLFKNLPETTPEQVKEKEKEYRDFEKSIQRIRLKQLADAQVAQFFIPKKEDNKQYLLTDAEYRKFLRNVNTGMGPIQSQKLAYVESMLHGHRFFHWFIEFPEVFQEGGFDCILGNPPFLGGQKLSGNFGDNFLEYIKFNFAPIGAVDLVTYFFRRIFGIIRQNGFQSLISTNTIAQGRAKEDGLDVIVKKGGTINHAVKSMRWPGLAAVEVSLITIAKKSWTGPFLLSGGLVKTISTHLDDSNLIGSPFQLKQNEGRSFQGSNAVGKGFKLGLSEANQLISSNNINREVVKGLIIGDDLNSNYLQTFNRYIINFQDWEENYCKENYPECFKIIESRVRPERLKYDENKSSWNRTIKEKWWLFGAWRKELDKVLRKSKKVITTSVTSKHLGFSLLSTEQNSIIFDVTTSVISTQRLSFFSILQSCFHNEWVWKNCLTLGNSTLRYTSTDLFETFPTPRTNNNKIEQFLENIGEAYHEHRRQLMLGMQLGLTDTYNLFHFSEDLSMCMVKSGRVLITNHLERTANTISFDEVEKGIVKLREIHVQMDQAVLEAYGWGDVQLRHDFYEVDYLPENDRVRFTIHPDARKEVLKRLLELNHQIFEEEARQGLHKLETVEKFFKQKGEEVPKEVILQIKKAEKEKKMENNKPKGKRGSKGNEKQVDLF